MKRVFFVFTLLMLSNRVFSAEKPFYFEAGAGYSRIFTDNFNTLSAKCTGGYILGFISDHLSVDLTIGGSFYKVNDKSINQSPNIYDLEFSFGPRYEIKNIYAFVAPGLGYEIVSKVYNKTLTQTSFNGLAGLGYVYQNMFYGLNPFIEINYARNFKTRTNKLTGLIGLHF